MLCCVLHTAKKKRKKLLSRPVNRASFSLSLLVQTTGTTVSCSSVTEGTVLTRPLIRQVTRRQCTWVNAGDIASWNRNGHRGRVGTPRTSSCDTTSGTSSGISGALKQILNPGELLANCIPHGQVLKEIRVGESRVQVHVRNRIVDSNLLTVSVECGDNSRSWLGGAVEVAVVVRVQHGRSRHGAMGARD